MSRVFISHSTEDREFVERVLVPVLHGCGLETWYSREDIRAADTWQRKILDGLKASDWFLIVMSANSATSKWVQAELHWAMGHRLDGRIVPVMIEACDPYDFHLLLPTLQFVDYGQDRERALAQLKAIWVKPGASPPPREAKQVSEAVARVEPEPAPAKIRVEPVPPPPKMAEPVPDLITTKTTDLTLKLIPAGTFLMGSPEGEGLDRERPQHKVTISRPFYLGIHQVTQAQYTKLMGENPSYFATTGNGKDKVAGMDTSRFPVEMVSWYESVRFCNALSQAEGLDPYYKIEGAQVEIAEGDGYRLPTEAEWEYACRAGPGGVGAFCFGDDAGQLGRYAWCNDNSGGKTHPVGQRLASAFGLFDMHGNVWEWCWDGYADYDANPAVDPVGPLGATARVRRGGGWIGNPRDARSANRGWGTPEDRRSGLGFRLARVRSSR
jgi:formylglycine-generating enzyme required for sulfatase activity